MYSYVLLLVAAAGASMLARGLLSWRRQRSTLLLFCLAALAAVVAETLLAGLGRQLGAGDPLRDLYALPTLIATFAWPLSLFTFATLSRRLGFGWAKIDWGHGAVCLYGSALLVYGLPGLLALRAMAPACWQDVVWYLRDVPPALACPGQAGTPADGAMPIVLGSVIAAWITLGIGVWRLQGRPGPLVALASGAILLALPAGWGPLPWYLGLTAAFSAVVAEATRHAALLARPPQEPAPS